MTASLGLGCSSPIGPAGPAPPLTTIALPHEAMGRWAVNRLLDQIDGVTGADEPELRREHCPPVVRASVATVRTG